MNKVFLRLFIPVLILSAASPGNCLQTQINTGGAYRVHRPLPSSGPTETLASQARLLTEINSGLIHNHLSAEQAVYLRAQVQGLAEKEDRYLAQGNQIPASIYKQESSDLDGIKALLQRNLRSATVDQFKGTAVLQDQVKSRVYRCLTQGKISADRASDIRLKVNRICAEESWYLTIGNHTIPEAMMQADLKQLNNLEGQLKTSLTGGKNETALQI
jgi:hypothetical protein